jgi:hypothetical protein
MGRKHLREPLANDRAVAVRVGALGRGDADALATAHREDLDDSPLLIAKQGDADGANHRGVVPVATTRGAVRKIEHDLGDSGVAEPTPEFGHEISHVRFSLMVLQMVPSRT